MQSKKPIKAKVYVGICILAIAVLLCAQIKLGLAQGEKQIDVTALTQETQKISQEFGKMTMVWWIPEEFWRVTFTRDPNMTEAQIKEFINIINPYTLIVAVDAKIGQFGETTYKPETEIRSDIRIVDNQGMVYRPLSEDQVDADTKNFLLMMKPVFVNMLGPMGKNMYFFIFPAKNKDGRNIAEAKKEGIFLVKLDEKEFRWRLPLGSLLPPKICPTCQEELSGAYKFCPWDGTKLE